MVHLVEKEGGLYMPTPEPVSVFYAVEALTDLGVFPIVAVAAVLFLATMIYKRFRK